MARSGIPAATISAGGFTFEKTQKSRFRRMLRDDDLSREAAEAFERQFESALENDLRGSAITLL